MQSGSGADSPPFPWDGTPLGQLFREGPAAQLLLTAEDCAVAAANPPACRLLGLSEEQLHGRFLPTLFPDDSGDIRSFLRDVAGGRSGSLRVPMAGDPQELQTLEIQATALDLAGGQHIHAELRDVSAEARLRDAQAFYESLINHVPDLIFQKDRQGVYRSCNREFLHKIGKQREEVVGKTDHELLPEETARSCTDSDREAMSADQLRQSEEWAPTADGTMALFDTRKVPFRDARGQVQGILGIAQDITEKRRAEERLRESQRMLSQILATTTEGFWMGDFQTLETVDVNDAFCRLVGRDRGELIGTRPDAWVEPADLEILEKEAARRRTVGSRRYEFRFVAKDGRRIPVLANATTYFNEAGDPVYSVAFITDISRLKEKEEFLTQLVEILEAFPGLVGISDSELNILYHNQFALEFFGTRLPVQSQVRNAHPDWAARKMMEEAFPAATREGQWVGESALLDKDGREVPILQTLLVHYNDAGQVERYSSIGVDITAQKEAEARERRYSEQLNSISRLISMGGLVSLLSHQLNQPLAALSNYATAGKQLLPRECPDSSSLWELMGRIEDEARKAGEILAHVRKFLKGEGPAFAPLDPNQLVQELQPFVRSGIPEGPPVFIELDLDPALPTVVADHVQIQEALLNLIRNAMEANREHAPDAPGPVTLRTRHLGEQVQIAVVDVGPGLPEGFNVDALTPFFSTKSEGLGLGLWITHSILEAHHGRLEAWDNPDGRGATFQMVLPAGEQHPALY